MELYVDRKILGTGCFHEVSKALQRREFEKEVKDDGFIFLREQMLKKPKKWVIKKVKDYSNLAEVPFDIAKQHIAFILSEAFCKILEEEFGSDIYLKYVKPFMAIPLYSQEHKYVYELEEHQEENQYVKF